MVATEINLQSSNVESKITQSQKFADLKIIFLNVLLVNKLFVKMIQLISVGFMYSNEQFLKSQNWKLLYSNLQSTNLQSIKTELGNPASVKLTLLNIQLE